MNKCKGFSRIWFLGLLLVAVVAGCARNGGDPGNLISIKVTPATYSIPVTGTIQYTALATFGDGSARDVTAATTWTAGTSGVSFGAIAGLAKGVTASVIPVVITAKYNGKTATAALTVNDATSKGLKLSPASASIPVTGNQQYTLLETFSDGTTQLRTTDLATSWSTVNNSGNISLTPSGLTAGLAVGLIATPAGTPVTISASYNGNTVTASLIVNAATSKGIKLSPALASIPVTGNQQYTLLEIFSDGTSQIRTKDLATSWSTVNNSGNISLTPSGLTAGLAVGLIATPAGTPVTISASYGGNTATASLTVNAATSKGLKLSPASASIPVTGNQQYTLLEIFSDGTSQPRTTDLTTVWSTTNNSGNVSLTPSGLTAGIATGLIATPAGTPVTISASYGGNTVTASLTVTAASSKFLMLTPATSSIPVTGTQQYTLLEVFSDGTSQPRTADSATVWSTSNNAGPIKVSLTPSGLSGGLATGLVATPAGSPVVVYATYGGNTVTADLNVSAATSKKFEVTPLKATITISGGGQQYAAIETFSDGTTYDRTLLSTWSAVDVAPAIGVATIGLNNGIATGTAIGKSTITATYIVGIVTKTASAELTVTAPNPGPAGPAVNLGMAATFGIIATNAITSSSVNSHIYGDVALTTGVISSVTGPGYKDGGVAPNLTSSGVTTSDGVTPGIINTSDNGNLSVVQLNQLQSDLNAAYTDLSGRPAGTVYPAGTKELSGLVLLPGVYQIGASAASDTFALSTINGPLVLDAAGNPDALFILKAGAITTTTGSVVLQGGAQPKNIFWVVSSDATIGNGASTFFQGTIVAGNTITVGLNTNVQGRMLAGALGAGSITNSGLITVPK